MIGMTREVPQNNKHMPICFSSIVLLVVGFFCALQALAGVSNGEHQ
jgi:hypothetical protein